MSGVFGGTGNLPAPAQPEAISSLRLKARAAGQNVALHKRGSESCRDSAYLSQHPFLQLHLIIFVQAGIALN